MKKPKVKMRIEDRAKQFMPFAAVTGLDEAIREKEKEWLEQNEKSTDHDDECLDLYDELKG